MIVPTCARCWPRSRTAACCASRATRSSPSPPVSPAPRSTATPNWCIRRERIKTPLRRIGAKGEGRFAPISWDEALDEITARWKAIIAESGPLALLGYAYSAHQGQINRGLVLGLFHALGTQPPARRHGVRHLLRRGVEHDRRPGRRRRSRSRSMQSDLMVSWGADLVATNVHFWARSRQRERSAACRSSSSIRARAAPPRRADWHLQIRIGTDAALALGDHAHPGARRAASTATTSPPTRSASAGSKPRCCRNSRRRGWPRSPGSPSPTSSGLRGMYGRPKRSFIRLGEGMTRLARGGEALRAVALLPGVTGAYGGSGGGALLLTCGLMRLNYDAIRKPSGPAATRHGQPSAARRRAAQHADPPIRGAVHRRQQPGGDLPRGRQGAPRAHARGPVHRRARPFLR